MNRFARLVGWHRLAVAIAYCRTTANDEPDNDIQQPIVVELKQAPEQFTHKFLLQQTCTLSVNSSCQMITIALVALSDASQKYKDELHKIMDIMENGEWSDDNDLDNILMESRYDITNAKTYYLDALSALDSALQLGQSSVQMSFTVAATTVFNSMSERLYTAEKEFQNCIGDITKIEGQFTKLLAETLKKSNVKDNKNI